MSANGVKVERNIPIPNASVSSNTSRYHSVFDKMTRPGDSFKIGTKGLKQAISNRGAIYIAAKSYAKDHPGFAVTIRADETGLRVWRTE